MSADLSGSGKSKDGPSLGQTSSPAPEAGEVTVGKVDNACNSQAHSTPHCTQSQTNHSPIPAHTHSTDGTNQDGTSCHGDKGAKVGEQKDDLTLMTEKVSNSEQKCMGKSYEKIVGMKSASNEESESSMEDEDQSDGVESLGRKGGKQDKTLSENDAGDQSDQVVQEVEKINLDENHRAKSDTNKIPKGNEQMDDGNGAIQRGKEKKDKKHDQNDGFKDSDRRLGENEKDTGDGAIQIVEDEKHNQNSGCKDTAERPSENEEDIQDGEIRLVKYDDDASAKRPTEYERNDEGDKATQAIKEENPDVNKKVTDTKREPTEIEKNHYPDESTQTASVKKSQRSELSPENNGSEMSGNTNNDGKEKEKSDKKITTGQPWDPDMEPSNINIDETVSTVSGKDENGAMPGAVKSAIDNYRDAGVMENEGLGQTAVTATDQKSQTDFGMLKKELIETDIGTIENEGNDQEDGTKPISQAGNMELSDKTASVLGDPDKSLGDSDGGTKEIKDKCASAKTTPKTQTTQPDQDENHAYHQDETGATSSEPSHEILSFSQSQSDDTILDEQLDRIIDELATDSKLNENPEEWKKNAKEKIKSVVLTKVREETLSRKSFYPDVQHNKAVQSSDSDGTSTKDGGGPRSDPVDDSGGSLQSQSQSSSPTTQTEFLNANRGRVGTQSLHLTPGSSSRLSSQTSTKGGGGPRSDTVDESASYLPPQSPSSIPTTQTDFSNAKQGRVGTQSLHSTTGSSNRLSSRTSTNDAGGTRSDPVDDSGGSLPPKFPLSTLTTQTECFETKPGRAGSQSLHSTTGSSNELSFGISNNSSIKPRQGYMLEMKKDKSSELCPTTALSHSQQVTNQPDTFDNKLFSGTASTTTDSQQAETHPEAALSEGQKCVRNIRINIQKGSQYPTEFHLPCNTTEYFEWTFCLLKCFETLTNALNEVGIGLVFLKNKAPLFMIPVYRKDFVELLQQLFRETVKKSNIACHIFDWDMSKNDSEWFCNKWNDDEHFSKVFLSWDICKEKVTLCLVGEKAQIEFVKPLVESELQKYTNLPCADNTDPFTWRKPVKSIIAKIFEKTKERLETEFQVKISFKSDSEIEISATTNDIAQRVFRRVNEMSECVQDIELPNELKMLLLSSEKARLFIKTEMRKHYGLKIHFLQFNRNALDILQVFEENNIELEGIEEKILKNLFYIPSTDRLCKVFTSSVGETISIELIKANNGKVQIVFDKTRQPCCVGTKDVEEKIRNSLATFLLTKEIVILPSEEVWRFCQRYQVFQDIAKDSGCDYQLTEDAECRWIVEVSGPKALVSDCCGNIEEEIKKITTKTVLSVDVLNESLVTNLIDKWNAEKRCLINIRSEKSKTPAPWKKWIKKRGTDISMIYCVNFNVATELQDDEFRVTLIPEELSGARRKYPLQHIIGMKHHVQMFIPCSDNLKKKDYVTTRFKEALKINKENLQKRNMIVDFDRVPEKELKSVMKIIIFTLDSAVGLDMCIAKCEFCDTRLNMFNCMTEVIDTYLKNTNPQVFEWKGRSIEVDVQTGQLAQQKEFDVLVNSTSNNLDLNTGLISKSILKAAGPEIQEECNKYKRFKEGEIAVTRGYGLDCKYVFHGAIPGYNSLEKVKSLRSLRGVVRKCLEKADELMMESIAFPALGTGNLGYLRRDVANVIFEEVEKFEFEVKTGSVSRVCCVIYQGDIDALQHFQSRHSKWKQDHKVQIVKKEVMVTSDKPDVMDEISREIRKSVCHTAEVLEPPNTEITESLRLGTESSQKVAESMHASKKIEGSSQQKVDWSLEERLCLLIRAKEDLKEEDLNVWEQSLREDFRDIAENIVCPFLSPNRALLQFTSEKDVEGALKDKRVNKTYDVQKFPSQAVVGLEAVVSPRMVRLLTDMHITYIDIRRKSGVVVHQKNNETMILCGNILEIEAAFAFFSSIVKNASTGANDFIQEKLPPKGHISADFGLGLSDKADYEKLPIQNTKTLRLDDQQHENENTTESMNPSKISFRSQELNLTADGELNHFGKLPEKVDEPNQASSTGRKLGISSIEKLKFTDEDVIKLTHFHRNLMQSVTETTDREKSLVSLSFCDKDTERKVVEKLEEIKSMACTTIYLPKNVDNIEKIVAKNCSENALCYLSKDRQQIEIVALNRGTLNKVKNELEMLLTLESQKEEKLYASLDEQVFVTNQGISVYVKRASLLNLEKPVDAIVCPISRHCDLKHGLPKLIADLAGDDYVKELTKIFEENQKMFPEHFVSVIPGRNIKICHFVVNVATKQWRKGVNESKDCEHFLLQQMAQLFFRAEEKEIRSIAIPAICAGKCSFPKEICAKCYATSVVLYSRTIRDYTKGIKKVVFVDQSEEMITYIKSVFSQPDLEKTVLEREGIKSFRGPKLYPYLAKDGEFAMNEKLKITILNSKISKQDPEGRTLVYHEVLEKMEKSKKGKLITKWLLGHPQKQLLDNKNVYFCKERLDVSKIPNVEIPEWENHSSKTFPNVISKFYSQILREVERKRHVRIIMPLYGSVKDNCEVTKMCATRFINELDVFGVRLTPSSATFDIVMPIADQRIRDIMIKEIESYVKRVQAGFHRPN